MADLKNLFNSYYQKLTPVANRLSSFVQQNPLPAGYAVKKFQQAAVPVVQKMTTFQAPLQQQSEQLTKKIGSYLGPAGQQAVKNAFPITQLPEQATFRVQEAGRFLSLKPTLGDIAFNAAPLISSAIKPQALKGAGINDIGLKKAEGRLADSFNYFKKKQGEVLTQKDWSFSDLKKLGDELFEEAKVHSKVLGIPTSRLRQIASTEPRQLLNYMLTKSQGFESQRQQAKSLGQFSHLVDRTKTSVSSAKKIGELKGPRVIPSKPVSAQTGKGAALPQTLIQRKQQLKGEVQQPLSYITTKVNKVPKIVSEGTGSQIKPGVLSFVTGDATQPPKSPMSQSQYKAQQSNLASDSIISDARKQIGSGGLKEDKRTVKQAVSDLYTQWVDRYNPIVKVSQKAKLAIRAQGAELRPEVDPEYLVRRLTGAGGIADTRFRKELKPIIDLADNLKINKDDLDVYLANKRIAGFGKVGREVYGADPIKASQVVVALEAKYPNIGRIADSLYTYQNKGFQEMVEAGFLSPDDAKVIQSQNPDYSPLYRVMDEVSDYLGLPTRKTMQGTQPVKKIQGSTRQIESPLESIIGNTFSQRAAIEKNKVAKSIIGLQQVTDMGFKKVTESGPDTITVWNGGKKEYWQVGQEIADVAKGVNEEAMNLILKIVQAPAALLRQGATGRNPEFMIPNIIRDQLDAGITSKYGYIPFIDYLSGLKSMLTNDEVYRRWESSGAKIDLGELSGKKSIHQLFDEKTARKGLFSWLGKTLDVLGKYSEQPTRVGLFKKAYGKTGNELLAAMESRDATVDFARMGSKMKVANSIIPFLNVGVQGFDKLIRSVKNNPGKVLLNMSIYGAAPAIATTLYNLTNHPQEYADIPEYEKESNFVLIKGRNAEGTVDYVTIPKGNILPVVANPIQSFLEYVAGANGKSLKELAINTFSETLPVLSTGNSLKEVGIKTIGSNLPQAIKPITESLVNKSFYKYDTKKEQSKDIVPYYLQERPAYMQSYKFTPEMYKKIGAVVNVSPLQVQNIMEGYLAGYTKIPAQLIQLATKASRGEEISPNDKTIIRRFFKQTYPGSAAKPQERPAVPSLMDRVMGKVSASGETMTPDQEKWAIEDEKYKMRSGGIKTSEVNGKILYTKDNGDIGTIDPSFQPTAPKLTGNTELDKKLISKYKGEVTSKANDIVALYEAGKIDEAEAEKQLQELKRKSSVVVGTKRKKFTLKKLPTIKLPKVSKSKVKKITVKPRKVKEYKLKKPKLSKSKVKLTGRLSLT